MAKIEVNSILGSSQDNFLVFSNDNFERPYVTFYFNSGQNPIGQLVIKDALNEDGYKKTIVYSPDELITDSSFRCIGDKTANTFSFMECLRKNIIFYDITLVSDIPNVGMVIRAYLDSSTRYTIQASAILTVGGNYSSYVPKEPNKYVLLLNDGSSQVTLEKHTIDDDISFNVTAPFEHLSFKDPFGVKMVGYHVEANQIITENIANNQVTVFPTTLSKFDETNLMDYNYSFTGQKVNFLTHNFNRYYNYGEVCGLSLLTNKSGIGLVKQYYTVSGKYLGTDSDMLYSEVHPYRKDFYFECDIQTVENTTNKQVGYVEVFATEGGAEITNRIRFNVVPKCNQNNEIFFVNELGGIDSFNFLGERVYESKINKQTTYFINPTRKYVGTRELECVNQKVNKVEHHLKSALIDVDTARWLNEMSKSKYPFLYVGENNIKFERIVITDMSIEISDRDNTFEIELTYQDGDNNIRI